MVARSVYRKFNIQFQYAHNTYIQTILAWHLIYTCINKWQSQSKSWLQKYSSCHFRYAHYLYYPSTRTSGFTAPLFFGGIRVAHLLSILCCVVCFVCHRLVTCVLNVAYVSGLSIPACPFGFLDRLFYVLIIMDMWIVLCIFNAMCWSFGGGNRTT
jgi:hypothetical protein